MSKYRQRLPQLADRTFITDGGLETTLIYHENIDLPHFAAFVLLEDPKQRAVLDRYFSRYVEIARSQGVGAILETATWRANPDWGAKLGYDARALADVHRRAVEQLEDVRSRLETPATPIVISGNLGPRGDGYRPDALMSADEAERYHGAQIRTFRDTAADMVAAFTMNYVEEAIGIASAAKASAMPVAISFTIETNGRLPTGMTLQEAIERTDEATSRYPAYYMVNCAHPTHFADAFDAPGAWRTRLRGLRANASSRSHADLDAATEIDIGDPQELARQYRTLQSRLPGLTIVGGCCGTDDRHVDAMCRAMQRN